jgi:acetylornithine deacetylase
VIEAASAIDRAALLALHADLVAIRSVSGEEAAIAAFVHRWLAARGVDSERLGNSVLARIGPGGKPALLLNSHLDTVPASAAAAGSGGRSGGAGGWTHEPFAVTRQGNRVVGLGSNDAKAAVAAMMTAVAEAAMSPAPRQRAIWLALVEGEETKGVGTQAVLADLRRRAVPLAGAVFGEPTNLDIAIAQKGLLILELHAKGTACHAAHAAELGATNALRILARDLVALEAIDLGAAHPRLGAMTLEPTQATAGVAHNVIPGEAQAVLDLRTTPMLDPAEIVRRVQALVGSEVRVRSSRLLPVATEPGSALVRLAAAARPAARLYGSPTLSDMAFAGDLPAIKCGPGRSERSHTADEFVLEEELVEGWHFYRDLIANFEREGS